jgi:pre-60S factor REI1
MEEGDSQIISVDSMVASPVTIGSGSSELIIRHDSEKKQSIKILGSREFARYYKQRPRPSEGRDSILVNALVAR